MLNEREFDGQENENNSFARVPFEDSRHDYAHYGVENEVNLAAVFSSAPPEPATANGVTYPTINLRSEERLLPGEAHCVRRQQ